MKHQTTRGNTPVASALEIIEAWKRTGCVAHVCKELRAGTYRVERVLAEAGLIPEKRSPMREAYILAISDYENGVPIEEIKERHGVCSTQLYRRLDECGIARRSTGEPKDWHCWECGVETSPGEIFCCDDHRRVYNAAAIRPGFRPPVHNRREFEICRQSTP